MITFDLSHHRPRYCVKYWALKMEPLDNCQWHALRYTIAYNYFNVHLQYLKFYNLKYSCYWFISEIFFRILYSFVYYNLFEVINLNKYCLVIHALSDVQRIFSLKFDVFGHFNPNSMPGQAIIYFQYKACIMFFWKQTVYCML